MGDESGLQTQDDHASGVRRVLLLIGTAACLSACTTLGISPRPTAALIRLGFDRGGTAMSAALAKHVPPGVSAVLDERYDSNDGDARLDVFYPARLDNTAAMLPAVVWVHGGAWVSGDKGQVANYLRVLAGKGYTVVGVNYSIAPRGTYPLPLRQVNAALGHLQANAGRLHVDASRFFLAGDSAGAQIAAQLANIVSAPAYASTVGVEPAIRSSQLRGVMLYCGAYDMAQVNLSGASGVFLKTVLWSYAGTKDFATDPAFAPASVLRFVTPAFPPAFISVGNADPLAPQSHAMAKALAEQKVEVDDLFFPKEYASALPHEYQFDLDGEAGRQALERSVRFLAKHSRLARDPGTDGMSASGR